MVDRGVLMFITFRNLCGIVQNSIICSAWQAPDANTSTKLGSMLQELVSRGQRAITPFYPFRLIC